MPATGDPICGTDCDDTRAGVSPVATETCDARDNDCDGSTDEGVLETYYPDADGDGFGDPAGTPVTGCFLPPMHAEVATDCDDTVASTNPSARERCDGTVDDDCDTDVDEGCTCTDGEGRDCADPGVCASGREACVDGTFGVCSIRPVAETCNRLDDDCDGATDESLTVVCYADADNDGYPGAGVGATAECPDAARTAVGGCPSFTTNRAPTGADVDCADTDPTRRPGFSESCNAIDDDCDGVVDEGLRVACWSDGDNDGYAPAGATMTMQCPASDRPSVGGCPLGTTNRAPGAGTTDCDDSVSTYRPGGTEVCTSGPAADEDCDGATDEGVAVTCYADTDGDTFAAMGAAPAMQCRDAGRPTVGFCPINYTDTVPVDTTSIDCAPTNAAIHPDAVEVCDMAMVDEDCDGVANPPTLCTCTNGSTQACPQPGVCAGGTQSCSGGAWGACSVSPTTETCDDRDEDCNGVVDDELRVTCYADADNDTYAPAMPSSATFCPVVGREAVGGCPVGYTNRVAGAGTTDCNDAAGGIHPGGTEVCADSGTAADEDCDSMTDEGLRVTCYTDGDGDTYAPSSAGATSRCSDATRPSVGGCPAGYTNRSPSSAADCNDGSSAYNPGVSEICDRIDHNCSSGGGTALDEDADGDMHASPSAPCSGGYPKDDCRDDNASIYTGAPEPCNRVDNNCSTDGGTATEEDADADGYAPIGATCCSAPSCPGGYPATDCNDLDSRAHPGHYTVYSSPMCRGSTSLCTCSDGRLGCTGFTGCGCSSTSTSMWDFDCNGSVSRESEGCFPLCGLGFGCGIPGPTVDSPECSAVVQVYGSCGTCSSCSATLTGTRRAGCL
ncbi:MAG: putative metal-binding motif-containing protein [Gammaproteobacteria bacterium]|nr:putative metal-binding motif-containing protein [Gammaproteobacteria bacterium]